MFPRILFALIALFWVTMNVLLWRAEYGARRAIGSPVPVETVWRKILDAPDDSSLAILRRGKRIGFCRLQTSVGEQFSKLDEAPKEGFKVKSKIRFDGHMMLNEASFRRLRFECDLSLTLNLEWEQFNLRIMHRPITFEVRSTAMEQTVYMKFMDRDGEFERAFKFSEFQNPLALLNDLAGPIATGMFDGLKVPETIQQPSAQEALLKWEARNDTLTIGHEPVRVYRLQTSLAGRYNVAIFVSRAGEILKAELPEGIVLLHEKLSNY